jgi:DNA-binding CsgD family transcriptional regulator/energy-coupling factor transporter ATP-binding protein EcfA2
MRKHMIGRVSEQELLRDLLDQARAGHGKFLMIIGEPGVGKSMLLNTLSSYARETDGTVLSGRAVEGAGTFRPLAEALMPPLRAGTLPDAPELRPYRAALGRLLPDWATPSVPETRVDPILVLGEGVLRLLTALDPEGCVLLLEDLHWADAETLALLDYLSGAVAAAPLLIAATAREHPSSPALKRLIGAATSVIALGRLGPEEVDEMIELSGRSLDEPERELIRHRSEGLPLLVDELLTSVPSDSSDRGAGPPWSVPASFAAVVESRLDSLDEPGRRVLSAAATLGVQPDWDLVPAIAGLDGDRAVNSLRRAVRAELLIIDGSVLTWRHALTREAIWAGLLPPERAVLSRRAAQVLLDRAGPDQELAAAELLVEAGDSDDGAALLLRIAERELAVGALRSAESILDQVAATGRFPIALASDRVEHLALTGRLDQALQIGVAALDGATGDDHAELCLRLARVAILVRRWGDADAYVARARRPSDPRSLILLADSAHGAGRIEAAAQFAARAVELAEQTADAEIGCEALIVQARIVRLGDGDRAGELFRRAAELAAEHGLKPWRVEALLGCGTVELLQDENSPTLLEARDLATDLGLLVKATSAELLLADHRMVVEGPAAVQEASAFLAERGRLLQLPMFVINGQLFRTTARAVAGDRAAVAADLDGLPSESELLPEFRAQVEMLWAIVAAVDHDLRAAVGHLNAGVEPLLDHRSVPPLHPFGFWVLMRTVIGDRDDEARAKLRQSGVSQRRANAGALHYADAVAAGRQGDRAGAEQAYTRGEEALTPVPWWHRFLRLFTLECAVADGWGDPVPQLRADLTAFEADGNVRLARFCRDLLRRAGAPTRRGRGDSTVPPALRILGITSRELDVLTAVTAGRSNAEVAEQLFLSVRTVETHVASLLAKTGVGSRTELRDWHARLTP